MSRSDPLFSDLDLDFLRSPSTPGRQSFGPVLLLGAGLPVSDIRYDRVG
ncbi:MAG: hypothetical protein QF574_02325 [Arenicellales bacterium]|nr:hypothetical protein [Arenicellales bacterium]